jgi:hypothetical protein
VSINRQSPPTEEKKMAKGQLRSNREKKKPKQQKAKPAAGVPQFSVMQPKPVAASATAKKQ